MSPEKLREGMHALLQEYGFLGVGKAWIEAMPRERRVSLIAVVMQLRLEDGSHVPNRLLADEMQRYEGQAL